MRTRFLTRFTAIALVAIVAGQFAVAEHAATADHEFGERCDVCLSGDRLAHAVAQPPTAVALPPIRWVAAAAAPVVFPVSPPTRRHARAPPIL